MHNMPSRQWKNEPIGLHNIPGLWQMRPSLDCGTKIQETQICLISSCYFCRSVCRLLIQAGYDVNIKDYDGWTPLHAAAHWGKEEACRILVEHLCDMDIINKVVWVLWFCLCY